MAKSTPMRGYGRNTGQVKRAINKGGQMAGGRRRGPAAPNMTKNNRRGAMGAHVGGGKRR